MIFDSDMNTTFFLYPDCFKLEQILSPSTDDVFKFTNKKTLHELVRLDMNSYLDYGDEIRELTQRIFYLAEIINEFDNFKTIGDSGAEILKAHAEQVINNNIQSLSGWLNSIIKEELPNYPRACTFEEHYYNLNGDIAKATSNIVMKYGENFNCINQSAEEILSECIKIEENFETIIEEYNRITVLNDVIEDVAYDLEKVVNDLRNISITDVDAGVEMLKNITLNNYNISGEIDTTVLEATSMFTTEEKEYMKERVELDILADLGVFGDIDPAERINITKETIKEYVILRSLSVENVAEYIGLSTESNGEMQDSHTLDSKDIYSALEYYMDVVSEIDRDYYIGHDENEEYRNKIIGELYTVGKALNMLQVYENNVNEGYTIVDINVTLKTFEFVTKEKNEEYNPLFSELKREHPSTFTSSITQNKSEEYIYPKFKYNYVFVYERNNLSDASYGITFDISEIYLNRKSSEYEKEVEYLENSFLDETAIFLIKETAGDLIPPGVSGVIELGMSYMELYEELEKAEAEKEEIDHVISTLEATRELNAKLERLDNYNEFEYSTSITIDENGGYNIIYIPNGKTYMIMSATKHINTIFTSEKGSVEYESAMNQLYEIYKANGGGLDEVKFANSDRIEELLIYKDEIALLSTMSEEEIIEKYGKKEYEFIVIVLRKIRFLVFP